MSLPTTITVNVGSPAADVVYGNVQREGNSVTYTAPSPQGDLEGVLSQRFASEKTGRGIVRTLHQTRLPVYNTVTGQYAGEVTIQTTVIRPATVPVTLTALALETHQESQAQTAVKDAILAARL